MFPNPTKNRQRIVSIQTAIANARTTFISGLSSRVSLPVEFQVVILMGIHRSVNCPEPRWLPQPAFSASDKSSTNFSRRQSLPQPTPRRLPAQPMAKRLAFRARKIAGVRPIPKPTPIAPRECLSSDFFRFGPAEVGSVRAGFKCVFGFIAPPRSGQRKTAD